MDIKKRKHIRLKKFDYSLPYPFFITICCAEKERIFVSDKLCDALIKCIHEEKNRTGFKVFAYCIMPDHVHLVIMPSGNGSTVSEFIGAIKSKTSKLFREMGTRSSIWQDRFYDHVIRKEEGVESVANYVLNNPVRKGIVQLYSDYKYSGIIDYW